MKIELLYFEGCPNFEPTAELLREAVAELRVEAEIEIVKVVDAADAEAKRFLGSPSIRINGRDLEISEDKSTAYTMRCRLYHTDSLSGVPSKAIIDSALKSAMVTSRAEREKEKQ